MSENWKGQIERAQNWNSEIPKACSSDFPKNDQSSHESKLIFASGVAVYPQPDPLTGLDATLVVKCQKKFRIYTIISVGGAKINLNSNILSQTNN